MSLITIINRLEEERSLNHRLLTSLLAGLDADILQIEQRKRDLEQEFAERDASLLRIIEGDQAPAAPGQSAPMVDGGEPTFMANEPEAG